MPGSEKSMRATGANTRPLAFIDFLLPGMRSTKVAFWILFGFFVVASTVYLHRMPGLLGDEASEGENVYELLTREGITVTGERSYIGPLVDYIRVPFVGLFGYSALALRVPMLLFSLITFWLMFQVLLRQFGKEVALVGAAALVFSPVYLTYQRLGWAITLFPFWLFLLLWLGQQKWQAKWLWIGLAAGLGLANHILFLPVLVGLFAGFVVYQLIANKSRIMARGYFLGGIIHPVRDTQPSKNDWGQSHWDWISNGASYSLLAAVGFVAGFGMQFAVMQLQTEDQGDPSATTQLFSERASGFISAAPLYLSGSSYMARYTGVELAPSTQLTITWVLLVLGFAAIVLNWRNAYVWALAVGLDVHLLAMLYMIDRFTLRYFWIYALGIWLLAGIGLGSVIQKIARRMHITHHRFLTTLASVILAVFLMGWAVAVVWVPFLKTGGSTADFSLGDRTNSARDFVDVRPLVACLRGRGFAFSENIHIWNRLQYLSHSNADLLVVSEDEKHAADLLIAHRDEEHPEPGAVCPELEHFAVTVQADTGEL